MRNLLDVLYSTSAKDIRPRLNQSDALVVSVMPVLRSIVDYEVTQSRLTLAMTILFEWTDELLRWNKTDFGNVSHVWISANKVWIPNIHMYTVISDNNQLLDNTNKHLPDVYLAADGRVRVLIVNVVEILCEPYILKYPYDSHECIFFMSSESYHSEIEIEPLLKDGLWAGHLVNNTRWEYVSSAVFSLLQNGIRIVGYQIKFKRYRVFLTLNMIVPVAILTAINPLVFVLPNECGERVSYSITIFLAFIVFLSSLADELPEANNPMSIYNIFLIVQLVYSGLIIVMVSVISRLEHKTNIDSSEFSVCSCKKMRPNSIGEEKNEETKAVRFRRITNNASFVFFVTFAVVEYIIIGILLTY